MNPYETPGNPPSPPAASPADTSFPYLSVGPLTGASVGLSHGVAILLAWTLYDRPDFLVRTPESAVAMTIGLAFAGALFGLLYGLAILVVCRTFHRTIRPRLHFIGATFASAVLAYAASAYSLEYRDMINPFLVIWLTVAFAGAIAMLTSTRTRNVLRPHDGG